MLKLTKRDVEQRKEHMFPAPKEISFQWVEISSELAVITMLCENVTEKLGRYVQEEIPH